MILGQFSAKIHWLCKHLMRECHGHKRWNRLLHQCLPFLQLLYQTEQRKAVESVSWIDVTVFFLSDSRMGYIWLKRRLNHFYHINLSFWKSRIWFKLANCVQNFIESFAIFFLKGTVHFIWIYPNSKCASTRKNVLEYFEQTILRHWSLA